jgi:tRNA U34 5-carboxymethylaminomethyl modifying GTPase MnmE/TrmE
VFDIKDSSMLNQTNQLTMRLAKVRQSCASLGEVEWANQFDRCQNGLSHSVLRVVVFGEFNRGKSTLINALLGRPLLRAKLVPTTGTITRLRYDPIEQIEVYHRDGRVTVHPLSELESLTTLDPTGQTRVSVTSIIVNVNSEPLRSNTELIDTPGVAERSERTQLAHQAIADADVVLFVLDARQLLNDRERNVILQLNRELNKPIVPVINFLSMVESSQVPDIRLLLSEWCAQLPKWFGRSWFEVNAMTALRHQIQSGPPPTDDFTALRESIFGMSRDHRNRLQAKSRLGQIRHELAKAHGENARKLAALEVDSQRVAWERAKVCAALNHQLQHLTTLGELTQESQLAAARNHLNTSRDGFLGLLSRYNGEELQRLLNGIYSNTLGGAARDIEKSAHQALLNLAGNQVARPEPLTICENLVLAAQMKINPLATIPASDGEVKAGAVIGGIVGTFFMPGAGTVAGVLVGGWLASWFGETEVDPVANARMQVREIWLKDAQQVIHQLQNQFAARLQQMKADIQAKVELVRKPLLTDEIAQRKRLADTLGNVLLYCDRSIQEIA